MNRGLDRKIVNVVFSPLLLPSLESLLVIWAADMCAKSALGITFEGSKRRENCNKRRILNRTVGGVKLAAFMQAVG